MGGWCIAGWGSRCRGRWGRSVLLRMLAAWRMHQAALFGEPQTVLHVAHSLNTTEEVFLPALQWAKRRLG